MQFPIQNHSKEILDALRSGRPLVLKAPTGTGKSTVAPRIALESSFFGGGILVLEPRRLAARMLAGFVAGARNEQPGETIGFQTRFEQAVSEKTRVRFITEGILPRLMLADSALSEISLVIFDEFHERSLATDLGLALIQALRRRRPDLGLMVMSATLETGALEQYLDNACTIAIEARTWPVEQRYMPPQAGEPMWDAAARAAKSLLSEGQQGDILIFMPGAYEIRRTIDAVEKKMRQENPVVIPLYGSLPAHEQHRAMQPCARRRIVVATNIAETSLTIPGIRHVIDSGYARVNRYDPARGFNTLYIEQISRASARQRAGRAGREAGGICIRLWSRNTHMARPDYATPEIARIDLAETVLYLRMLGVNDPAAFGWLAPPRAEALAEAEATLRELGLVDAKSGAPTPDGARIASLPMHPRLGRLVTEASARGAPREGCLAAALLSERPITAGSRAARNVEYDRAVRSDILALEILLTKAQARHFDKNACNAIGVNVSAARQALRSQEFFIQMLRKRRIAVRDSGVDPAITLARALLLAYPDRLARRQDAGTALCIMREGRRGELAYDSIARKSELLVAANIRETVVKKGQAPKILLSMATEIRREWLEEFFPDQWRKENIVVWNQKVMAAEAKTVTSCLGVIIEETAASHLPESASELLAEKILERNLPLAGFDTAAKEWIGRVQWLAHEFPPFGIAAMAKEDLRLAVHELCSGETRYAAVKKKPVLPLLKHLLSPQQHALLERFAPPVRILPSGRKLRIAYKPGEAPRGRARIQDLYDQRQSPTAGESGKAILLEILAPNMRPVQITDDLRRFWEVHYPEIKSRLSRKYPKHEWR